MAKLIREYENELEKRTLIFRGEEFSYTMRPNALGRSGDAPCFQGQLEERFPGLSEDILESVDELDFSDDEYEIFATLEMLDNAEQ
jgi:hypothetical protein